MSAPRGRRTARDTALAGLLAASALAAAGRFRSALALAAGALVSVLSVLWLSGVVERLAAARAASGRFDGTFAMKGVLRYAAAGVLLYGAVRLFPGEVPWLLAGVSAALVALVCEEIGAARRTR